MNRFLALLGFSLMIMLGAAAPAQAGGCYRDNCDRGCYQRDCCQPRDCCRRKVCHRVYRYETRKVFVGYRYDCEGCRYPQYRYEKVKVYAGKRCTWTGGGYAQRQNHDDDDAYQPQSYGHDPYRADYSGASHAFPNYQGD